ncbi:MAG TPA: hypothetical protein G4O02_18585 [Caldilineae bacterium]|nr:hypothetical protein [Caldilineae bacterium]
MPAQEGLKERVMATLDTLPEEALEEVAMFLEYLEYKLGRHSPHETPYKPVSLGGLWEGATITEEDIAEIRREIWGHFGEREL